MVRLAVLSDTHVPTRAPRVPLRFCDRIEAADHTVHAGDFDSREAFERIERLAGGNLTAVAGNADPETLDLPAVATLPVEDVTFVVTHGTGSLRGYEERVARVVRDEGVPNPVGVAGHTHRVLDAVAAGVRLLNPGSATGVPPAEAATMMSVTVHGSDVAVRIHWS